MNQDASVAAELGTGWFGAGLSPHAVTRLSECCASVTSYAGRCGDHARGRRHPSVRDRCQGRVALRLLVPERGADHDPDGGAGRRRRLVGAGAALPRHLDRRRRRTDPPACSSMSRPCVARCARTPRWRPLSTPVCWRRWRAGWERPVTSCSTSTRRKRNAFHGDGRSAPPGFLPRAELDRLLTLLQDDGRTVIGPIARDGAIVYDEVRRPRSCRRAGPMSRLPGAIGSPRPEPAPVRLHGGTAGLEAVHAAAPRARCRTAIRQDGTVRFEVPEPEAPRLAFLGVRACEIAALLVQDRVLAAGPFVDDDFRARRAKALVIAVQCTRAGSTCFCTSMGTGPEVTQGYDLVLTELDDGFLVEAGSQEGASPDGRCSERDRPLTQHRAGAAEGVAACRASMAGQGVAAEGLPARLMDRLDSPRWIEVADRCLACANCTMVCPTCFCTSVGAGLRPGRRRHHDRATLGLVLQRRLRQGRRRQLPTAAAGPISAVAHPQVRHLARAVRHLRLRRLRALHHLVPGGHRRARGARRHRSAVRGAAAARCSDPRRSTTSCRCPWSACRPACHGTPPSARPTRSLRRCVGVVSETADTSTLRLEPRDQALLGRQTRPVRHGRAARLLAAADLGLARRRRCCCGSPSAPPAPRPRRSIAPASPAPRSACADRSAKGWPSSARWAATSSSWRAASAWPRCGR